VRLPAIGAGVPLLRRRAEEGCVRLGGCRVDAANSQPGRVNVVEDLVPQILPRGDAALLTAFLGKPLTRQCAALLPDQARAPRLSIN
jgi:hypothetical protein